MSGKVDRLLIAVACSFVSVGATAVASSQTAGGNGPAATPAPQARVVSGGLPETATAALRSIRPASSTIPASTDDGSTAAAPGTVVVYRNEITPPPGVTLKIWEPGAGQFMADDIELASGACQVTSYMVAVAGFGESGPTFNVVLSLWNGDPCKTGSSMIAGTNTTVQVPNNAQKQMLQVQLPTPVTMPTDVVWLQASFSTSDSGWIVAENAEVGYSRDLFVENDLPPPDGNGCAQLYFEGDPPASFWAGVTCNLPFDPPGACCEGGDCHERTETACAGAGGAWLGAYSQCSPSPCKTGACCTDDNFTTCTDTTEAQCAMLEGLFHAVDTCAAAPCDAQFHLYRNDKPRAGIYTIDSGSILADDQTMAAGTPCGLASFDLDVFSFAFSGSYDATAELWTVDGVTGYPLMPIPGTRRVFSNLGDGAFHTLLAGPYSGITLPKKVWMTLWTTTEDSGWMIGQQATLGYTGDQFAVYDGLGWDLFDFENQALWAGFRANVRCYGTAPTGACCNDGSGTCLDGLLESECEGRWIADGTCAADPFDPPCGAGACCTLLGGCQDLTREQCDAIAGDPGRGFLCEDIGYQCPRVACLEATEDCFTTHGSPGCEKAFCCESVCDVDPRCCTTGWDGVCTQLARSYCLGPPDNDHCAEAERITAAGTYRFDNTLATTDGPPHADCAFTDGDDQTRHDVWYCLTSPCTDTVYVQTCGLTSVDSKINVYAGCDACPPTDADLLMCNDDFCGYEPDVPVQSQVSFAAQTGEEYLIRVGTFPGSSTLDPADGGPGAIRVTCGIPSHPGCPSAGHCCLGKTSAGCAQKSCCDTVCACDPYCCEVVWDDACATTGYEGQGCGAEVLCTDLCENFVCRAGTVRFIDPPSGVIDARQPHPPGDATRKQGLRSFRVEAPPQSDSLSCWTLCETGPDDTGIPNAIRHVTDNGDGTVTVDLARPITPGAVTTITYTDENNRWTRGVFSAHPANVDADSQSSPSDILRVIDYLNRVATSPWGLYSEDVDHSGMLGPPDILRVIDLLNGAGQFDRPWLYQWRPRCDECCP